ncbi:cation:proton antiporter [Agrococcus sp. ARC_14]|uniref:cation:proton antiporter n=1 Tax=Agrococcus sp. ARC_14 TaxID=2919927 RepID=UPI001F06EC20|nr:cation:proton antiporter [Agrococcus sp. ARC_14]MCH1882087.1 cation:proton antiporter [Agrococcus sp. ARC_14]
MHGVTTEVTLVVVIGILIIGAVATIANRIGVAAPLLLVVLGAGISLVPGVPGIEVPPEVFLTIILPPLLYTAALKVPAVDFRRNLRVIGYLSVFLVAVSALAVALVLQSLWPVVGFAAALALGAVVAPPDAVAATALGKRLGLPPRVVTILEGEGLINDATALVLLSTAVAAITRIGNSDIEVGPLLGDFALAVVVALVVGALVGAATVRIRQYASDRAIDTAISLATPFLSFLAAESLHGSGIVAVVITGLVIGNRSQVRIRATRRAQESATWSTFSLVVENGVFLTMGMQLPAVLSAVDEGERHLVGVVLVGLLLCLVLLVVRFASMPPLLWWLRRTAKHRRRDHERLGQRLEQVDTESKRGTKLRRAHDMRGHDIVALADQRLGWRDMLAIGWAGMRGVVTVAAVQTLPAETPMRAELVLIAFVVAIVTLLVQGGTLAWLVRLLHLTHDGSERHRRELDELLGETIEAGIDAMQREAEATGIDAALVEAAGERMRSRRAWAAHVAEVDPDDATTDVAQIARLRHLAVDAERIWLDQVRKSGRFDSATVGVVQRIIDREEVGLQADEDEH